MCRLGLQQQSAIPLMEIATAYSSGVSGVLCDILQPSENILELPGGPSTILPVSIGKRLPKVSECLQRAEDIVHSLHNTWESSGEQAGCGGHCPHKPHSPRLMACSPPDPTVGAPLPFLFPCFRFKQIFTNFLTVSMVHLIHLI